jgi:hypothetical protein
MFKCRCRLLAASETKTGPHDFRERSVVLERDGEIVNVIPCHYFQRGLDFCSHVDELRIMYVKLWTWQMNPIVFFMQNAQKVTL